MDLSIIIVSFNTEKLLLECIESIYDKTKNLMFDLIVVDNFSIDGTVESLKQLKHQNLTLIENKQNLGFSKANNIGVKKAKGRYILFLNPDTKVNENSLEGMVEFMDANKNAGASTSKVLLPNGRIDDASHRGFPTPWNSIAHFSGLSKMFKKTKLFGGYNLTYLDFNKTHEIDALAGAFMMVRPKAGEQVDWWDEDYFFYGEDIDFCYKLKQKDWKIYYVPQFNILHYKGVSGGIKKASSHLTIADKKIKKLAKLERFKAMRIFYKKHYEQKYPWMVTRIVYFGIWLKEIAS